MIMFIAIIVAAFENDRHTSYFKLKVLSILLYNLFLKQNNLQGRKPVVVKDFNPIIFLLPAFCDCTVSDNIHVLSKLAVRNHSPCYSGKHICIPFVT